MRLFHLILLTPLFLAACAVSSGETEALRGKTLPVDSAYQAKMVALTKQLVGELECEKGAIRVRALYTLATLADYLKPHTPELIRRFRAVMEAEVAKVHQAAERAGEKGRAPDDDLVARDLSLDPHGNLHHASYVDLYFNSREEKFAYGKIFKRLGPKIVPELAELVDHPEPAIKIYVMDLIRSIMD